MKLTRDRLSKIIKEELEEMMVSENPEDVQVQQVDVRQLAAETLSKLATSGDPRTDIDNIEKFIRALKDTARSQKNYAIDIGQFKSVKPQFE